MWSISYGVKLTQQENSLF